MQKKLNPKANQFLANNCSMTHRAAAFTFRHTKLITYLKRNFLEYRKQSFQKIGPVSQGFSSFPFFGVSYTDSCINGCVIEFLGLKDNVFVFSCIVTCGREIVLRAKASYLCTTDVQSPQTDKTAVQQHPDSECQLLVNKTELKFDSQNWAGLYVQHLFSCKSSQGTYH